MKSQMPYTEHLYCYNCGGAAILKRSVDEPYPGQPITLYTSSCCDASIINQWDNSVSQISLSQEYERQLSMECSDD